MHLEKMNDLFSERKYEEALSLGKIWVEKEPENGVAYAYTAFSCDSLGYEREAVPYYEKARMLNLEADLRREVLLGLGSTYRTIGEYEKSGKILKMGMEEFPNAREFPVFYALVLHNLKKHTEGMSILLKQLLETTRCDDIKKYGKALSFYADHLEEIW